MSMSRTSALVSFFVLVVACSGSDDAGLFGNGSGAGAAGSAGAATTTGGAGGTTGEGGAAGQGAGGEGLAGQGAAGAGTAGDGGAGGSPALGGAAGAAGASEGGAAGAGAGGTPGAVACEYKAYAEYSLATLEQKVNADLAGGWQVHSFHARPENNSGAAPANVAWMKKGATVKALGGSTTEKLAGLVTTELGGGATLHTILARPVGASVAPEVGWTMKGSVVHGFESYTIATVQQKVNADIGAGASLVTFLAREENNSGASKPNVVWMLGPSGYEPRADFSLATLASGVSTAVATGQTVARILARPHSSSVPTEVAWLSKGTTYKARESSSLTTLETGVNADLADGWAIEALFAREANNGGSAQPNVVWMSNGVQVKGFQGTDLAALAKTINAQVAAGATVHTIRARAHGSPQPPEVAWLWRPCP